MCFAEQFCVYFCKVEVSGLRVLAILRAEEGLKCSDTTVKRLSYLITKTRARAPLFRLG